MAKLYLSIYMTLVFLFLCSLFWFQSGTYRPHYHSSVSAAFQTDADIDKILLQQHSHKDEKEDEPETWNASEAVGEVVSEEVIEENTEGAKGYEFAIAAPVAEEHLGSDELQTADEKEIE